MVFFIAILWPLLIGSLVAVISQQTDRLYFLVHFFATSLSINWVWPIFFIVFAVHFSRHRPIVINEREVVSYILGIPWKRIEWNRVCVEKLTAVEADGTGKVETIILIGENAQKIRIRSTILRFEIIRELINSQILKLGISVKETDTSRPA